MKEWWIRFIKSHGDRLIFLGLALIMACSFMYFPDLKESGKTILIGVAMMAYNKARSSDEKEPKQLS